MSKKLLIVDNEEFFLESLAEGLSEFKEIFTTDICFSVDEAIKKYKKTQYDLIISDIRMPKKGGLSLLMYLRKHNYKGNFIAMTAYGSEEIFKKSKELGGFDIIMKPFDFDWFRNKIVNFFSEEEGVSGTLDSIDLTSLLQMINLEKKSLTVKIKIDEKQGFLYFKKGEIIHAEFDNLEGEQAALCLITMNKGRFSLMETTKKPKQTVNVPFAVLLLNTMKKIDENTKSLKEKCKEDEIFLKENNTKKKEEKMNIKKLNQTIEVLKGDMGEGLIATDIYGKSDGQSIVGFNSNPQACAFFNRITDYMVNALKESGFPGLGRYYILDLADGKIIVVISLGEYQWNMLVDRSKVQLGLLLNVIMPKITDAFEQSMTE